MMGSFSMHCSLLAVAPCVGQSALCRREDGAA
jgi:hypothetical protein